MSETRKAKRGMENLLYLFIVVIFVLALINAPKWVIDLASNLFVSAFIGAVTNFFATALVEELTGDLLKRYLLTIGVRGHDFSISLFVIVTLIVKLTIFH